VTKQKQCWNKWRVDQCWIDVTKERCELNESVQFAAEKLNGAVARNAGGKSAGMDDTATSADSFGIHDSSCRPSKDQSQARQRVTACCIVTPGAKLSETPGGNSKWHTSLVSNMPDGMRNTRQNSMKRNSPERQAPARKPAPAQKKRKGMTTRGDGEENVTDFTQGNKNGHFQSADKQSAKENDGQKHALAANKTSASQNNWWESPELHASFCESEGPKTESQSPDLVKTKTS
jgi:hypothetical protein